MRWTACAAALVLACGGDAGRDGGARWFDSGPALGGCARPWGSSALAGTPTDPELDPYNCGACGTVCPSGVCVAGSCVEGDASCAPACDGTAICCPHPWGGEPGCTSPVRDPFNCGGCGNLCEPGGVCVRGRCICAPGHTECDDRCVDTASDLLHCGGCGNACGPGTARCSNGHCLTCADVGLLDCDGSCVDPEWDHARCGRCDRACAADEACVHGQCVAGEPGCPTACAGSGENRMCCGGECINPAFSDRHCGGCGAVSCPTCEATCQGGVCVPSTCGDGDGD